MPERGGTLLLATARGLVHARRAHLPDLSSLERHVRRPIRLHGDARPPCRATPAPTDPGGAAGRRYACAALVNDPR